MKETYDQYNAQQGLVEKIKECEGLLQTENCSHGESSIKIEGKEFKYLAPDQIHSGDLGIAPSDVMTTLNVLARFRNAAQS